MSNFDVMKQFIKAMSGQENMVSIPKLYIQMFGGDIDIAILLSQVVYWSDKSKRTDGYFYKTYSEWENEIGLSEYKIKKAVKQLKESEIIETKLKRANGSPTIHYKLNMSNLQNLIIKFLDNQETSESESIKISESESEETSESLTETTQKITQENTLVVQPNIFKIYESEVGGLTPIISDMLKDVEKDYPDGWFKKAVTEAHKSTTRITLNYLLAILKRWKAEGLPQELQEQHEKKKESKEFSYPNETLKQTEYYKDGKLIRTEKWNGEIDES